MTVQDVLDFWFKELTPKDWFAGSEELDNKITSRFLHTHTQAAQGELYEWRATAEGRLAEIIVLDQFSRNIYRNKRESFASDPMALALAQEAIARGDHKLLPQVQRTFMYLPFMHSESKKIHERALELYSEPGIEYNLEYERLHKAIVDRFGRFPHRNKVLGRDSTPEEIEFLKQPGSSF